MTPLRPGLVAVGNTRFNGGMEIPERPVLYTTNLKHR